MRFRAAIALLALTVAFLTVSSVQAIDAGTYKVGTEIQPGVYAGNAGTDIGDSCYWERLRGLSGDLDDIIANDNAIGQFYVEVKSTDSYFTVRCEITPLAEWPVPSQPLTDIGTGMYIVGRDIAAGIYAGNAGSDIGDSCYWERLSGASGGFGDIIANDNAIGQFYVEVKSTDSYFTVRCEVTTLSEWPVPSQPLTTLESGMYLVDRDISPGTYSGQAGDTILDSCYWERLSGVSGDFSELIDNDNATGTYSVIVEDSDFALMTRCTLNLAETPDTGTSTLSVALTVSGTPLVRIGQPIGVTATFSAAVSGVTVSVDNGISSNFVGGDGDSVYTFDVTPDAIGDVVVNVFWADTSGALSLGIPYDDDGDGAISRAEVVTAIGDYLFGGLLTRDQVVALIGLYLFG